MPQLAAHVSVSADRSLLVNRYHCSHSIRIRALRTVCADVHQRVPCHSGHVLDARRAALYLHFHEHPLGSRQSRERAAIPRWIRCHVSVELFLPE
jgi:hypothetical protein